MTAAWASWVVRSPTERELVAAGDGRVLGKVVKTGGQYALWDAYVLDVRIGDGGLRAAQRLVADVYASFGMHKRDGTDEPPEGFPYHAAGPPAGPP